MISRLYKMFELDKLSNIYFNTIICAARSGQRYYDALDILKKNNCAVNNTILIDYGKLRPNIDDQSFQDYCKSIGNYATYRWACDNEESDVEYIINYFKDCKIDPLQSLGIDITGFTIPDIFRIFYVLKNIIKVKSIYAFYTEPYQYSFISDMFTRYEYLSGERTYKQLSEYSTTGCTDSEVLVCFLGFDGQVTNYLYDRIIPTDVVIINGFPSYVPKLKDISLLNNYEIIKNNVDRDNIYFTRANNPFSSYNVLCDLSEKFTDDLLNICVLGTKPMALGACMYSLDNPCKVKVTYPCPQYYQLNLHEQGFKTWCYLINL